MNYSSPDNLITQPMPTNFHCAMCGAAFTVVNALHGSMVQCPGCYGTLTILCIPPSPNLHPIDQAPGFGESVAKLLGYAALGFFAYKGLQAALDEDFGEGEFPQWFRDEMREDHIASYGSLCPRCEKRVQYQDLTIDHIVALINGGLTSRANAEIMCRRCNSRKGARNSIFDYARGRSN